MRVWLWPSVLLIVALVLSACGTVPVPTADPVVLTQGRELYDQYCAACHGVNLEGQPNWRVPDANGVYPAPPHDASGHTWHHPDALLLEIIANGGTAATSAMPAFGDRLSEPEMAAILAYIKSYWGPDELAFQEEVTRNAQR